MLTQQRSKHNQQSHCKLVSQQSVTSEEPGSCFVIQQIYLVPIPSSTVPFQTVKFNLVLAP